MTGRDLVSACLRLLGVVASGETPSSEEAMDGLASINRMIDSWSNEGLMVYATTEESPIALVGGTAAYLLGTGGSIGTRPMEIVSAAIRDGQTDFPVQIVTTEEYTALPNKSVQSNYPQWLYDDGGYPQRTVTLFPIPSVGNSLILWTKRPLAEISTLDDTIAFPPGYERALIYNGALELAPEYGRTPSDLILEIAVSSRTHIKVANKRAPVLRADPALVSRGRFNIYTGDYNR